jgi:hypothetical protein
MPTGSSDDARYGPAGFVAGLLTMLVLEFLTWVLLAVWYVLPVVVLPILIVVGLVAYRLTTARGTVAQIGRGMLIACAAAPLTIAIFIPAYIFAHAVPPI